MRTKKEKVPKIQKVKQKKKLNASNAFFVLLSLLLTAAVFIGLVVLENRLSGTVLYESVVTAKSDIPENTIITAENVNQYFAVTQIDSIDDISGSMKDFTSLIGQKALVPLVEGEIVLRKDFKDLNPYVDNLKNPVETAIDTGSLASVVGGQIRPGDLINISIAYTDNSQDSEYRYRLEYVIENVYVSSTLSASGSVVSASDTKTSATILILTLEQEDEYKINHALANGSLMRVSKVLNAPKEESNTEKK